MVDFVYTPLENLESETSAVQAINENFEATKAALAETLSRLSSLENQMGTNLDMNGNHLTNLGSPQSGSDAARWMDVYAGATLVDYAVPNLSGNAGKFLSTADGLTLSWIAGTAGSLLATANLSDLQNVVAARSNLGLGTASQSNIGTSGGNVPVLNTTNTWSAAQTFTSIQSFTGGFTLSGTADYRLSTSGVTSLAADSIGFRGAPQNIQDANYTLTLDDAGRGLSHTSSSTHTWTIPPNSVTAFPIHSLILLDNSGSGAVTIAQGAGVALRPNGSATTGSQTLAQNFVKTLFKEAADKWVIL